MENENSYFEVTEYSQKCEELINKENSPKILFSVLVALREEGEGNETILGRIESVTTNRIIGRMAQIKSEQSWSYFLKAWNLYGTDAGESLIFKGLAKKYFPDKRRTLDAPLNSELET